MSDIPCAVRLLPQGEREAAASKAVEVNPANGLAVQALRQAAPALTLPPEHLAVLTGKYWGARGVRLRVGFLDGAAAELRTRILSHMNAWGAWSNVQFVESSRDAQVRIGRSSGGGYWSYVGTDVLSIPAGQPTMNLDSFTMNTPDSEFYRVVRHETGHTLGFPHEHMRKEIVDRIDREKAIAYFGRTQGWTRERVVAQVLTPLESSALMATAAADPGSVMCYWLPAEIMKDTVAVAGGTDIDPLDAWFAARIYPGAFAPTSIWPNGKAYFFKRAQYLRYDPRADKTDAGHPQPIRGNWPGFPASFAAGVDSMVRWTNGKVYFFRGHEYLRYDVFADRVDKDYPQPIAANWRGLWPDRIEAGVVWPNGKAYFFRGAQYLRYDILRDRADPGYPKPISGHWPGMPADLADGIDDVVVWSNGKAYFFRGAKYLRYDVTTDRADPGYPKPIKDNWPGLWPAGVGTQRVIS